MRTLLVSLIITGTFLAAPTASVAQTVAAEVTVKFPVNLTQFGSDITKVRVSCFIQSDAITDTDAWAPGSKTAAQRQEFPMSAGQVNTAVTMVFSLKALDNPAGKSAKLYCVVEGSSPSINGWQGFNPQVSNVSFRTSSGNADQSITSNFMW